MTRYRQVLKYTAHQWRYLLGILSVTAVWSAVAALEPWPMKLLIDYGLKRQDLPSGLASLLRATAIPQTPLALIACAAMATLALFVIGGALGMALTWLWSVVGQWMVFDLSTDLFHRLQRLPFRYHARHPIGDSLTRLSGDTWCVYNLTNRLFSPFEQALTLTTIGAVAWRLNPLLTVFAFVTAPMLAASSLYFGRRLKTRAKLGREAHSRLTSFIHQTLACIPVVQAFTSETRNTERYKRLSSQAVELSQRATVVGRAYGLVNGLVTTIGAAAILYIGGRQVIAGTLSVGSLVVFLTYIRKMQYAADTFLKTYGSVKPVEASIDRVLDVLEISEDEVREAPGAAPLSQRPSGQGIHVRFEDVTFGYEAGREALKQITFDARPGETVALVGPTGAGKSTLVSLVPRFYDVWSGRISVDGIDVRQLKIASLRSQISIVLQDPFLFPMTVAENIAYGRPAATRSKVTAAAEAANADGFIRLLPDGYDTVLGEHGNTLSGGERQRVAIARALLKDAPLLILDEPTSALDTVTEFAVLEALGRLMAGRTTFTIAHRLSTIRGADKIIVLDEGRIIESGTHSELIKRSGLYQRLCSFQFGVFPREGAA
jgi:ATP-binding cassette subfamily B protein/subfamily B ATP-binding cassette protein MsbA